MEAWSKNSKHKISSLAKIVRLLSRLYLIPLYINDRRSQISFSLFSCKTLLFAILVSIPTIVLMTLVCLKIDYYTEVANSLYKIYNDMDIFAMSFVLFSNCIPFPHFYMICIASRAIAAVPELSMNPSLILPRKFKTSVLFIAQMNIRKEENKAK